MVRQAHRQNTRTPPCAVRAGRPTGSASARPAPRCRTGSRRRRRRGGGWRSARLAKTSTTAASSSTSVLRSSSNWRPTTRACSVAVSQRGSVKRTDSAALVARHLRHVEAVEAGGAAGEAGRRRGQLAADAPLRRRAPVGLELDAAAAHVGRVLALPRRQRRRHRQRDVGDGVVERGVEVGGAARSTARCASSAEISPPVSRSATSASLAWVSVSPARKLRKRSLSVGERKARYAVPRSDHSGDACQVTEPRALGCTSLSLRARRRRSRSRCDRRARRRRPSTRGAAWTVTCAKPAAVVCTPPARVGRLRPPGHEARLVGRAFDAPAFAAGDAASPGPTTRSQSALPPAASLGTRWRCVRLSLARPGRDRGERLIVGLRRARSRPPARRRRRRSRWRAGWPGAGWCRWSGAACRWCGPRRSPGRAR